MSYPLNEGDKVPSFSLIDQEGRPFSDADLLGKITILYFYPKDDTPGCTKEACDFRDLMPDFQERNAQVLGISPDDSDSHKKFIEKLQLNFPLLCDQEHCVSELFGVWREKNFMGRMYRGVERTTFVIDSEGIIRWVERPVRVAGHGKRVSEAIDRVQ